MEDIILNNLKKLIGKEFNSDDIICCFDTEETYVQITKDYDKYQAYYDRKDSKNYLIYIDDENIITDIY